MLKFFSSLITYLIKWCFQWRRCSEGRSSAWVLSRSQSLCSLYFLAWISFSVCPLHDGEKCILHISLSSLELRPIFQCIRTRGQQVLGKWTRSKYKHTLLCHTPVLFYVYLSHSWWKEGLLFNTVLLAFTWYPLADCCAHLWDIFPGERSLEWFGNKIVPKPEVSQVADHECEEIPSFSILSPSLEAFMLLSNRVDNSLLVLYF